MTPTVCPNKNTPEWKALVDAIGEEAAYAAFIANGEDIPAPNQVAPTIEDTQKIENIYEELVIPGFTAYLQDETVTHIMEQVLALIKETPGISFNKAISEFVLLAEDQVAERNEKYNPIIENIDRFRTLVKDRLDRIGLLTVQAIDPNASITAGEDSVSDGFYWEDDWVFKYDTKVNAQKRIKQFLTFIPKTDLVEGVYTDVTNYLDTLSFMAFDEVFEDLKALLSDTPNNWEAMRNTLQEHQEAKPWIYNLLYQLDNYDEDKAQLLNQFVSTFSSSYNNFKTLIYNKDKDQLEFKVIDTDQSSIINTTLAKWRNAFNTTSLVKDDENGDPQPDQVAVDKALAMIEDLQIAPSVEKAQEFLAYLGIDVKKGTAEELVQGRVGSLSFTQQFTSTRGLFNLIKHRLKGGDTSGLETEELINPVVNNSAVRSLAFTENKYNSTLYSNSTRNGEGNIVYSYSFNKYFTQQFQKLKDKDYLNSLTELTFHAPIIDTNTNKPLYNTWIYEKLHNNQFDDIFEISPFDTIKQSSREGTKLSNMSDVDIELTKWQAFQNGGRYVKGLGNISNYLLTIPSKTTSYIVTAPKVTLNLSGSNQFGKQVRDALYSIALTELQRINNSFGRTIELNKYKNGSKNFYFFPILNKENSPEIWNTDGTVKLPTTTVDNKTVESIIRQKVEAVINKNIQDKIDYWKSIGFLDDNNSLLYINKAYANSLKAKDLTFSAAADYIVNNTLFEFNMQQMFIGDPAVYYKQSVQDTWDDLGKRLAAQIAPGKDLALTSPFEKFISIKAQDREGNIALNFAQLKQRLGTLADPYMDLNGTDAQEYTTLQEGLYVKYRQGLITTEVYNNILERYKKDPDNIVLTEKELGVVMQPDKPVYVSTTIDTTQDVLDVDYVKSSSISLLPQFTKGLELDKIRKAMEKLEKEKGLPVRLAFNSATKVGQIKSVKLFNEDGTVKSDLEFTSFYKELNREGFRIQQDIPYDPSYEEVVKSSQVTKLLFDAILGIGDFHYAGETMTGKQLKEKWNDLHKQLFENSLGKVRERMLDPMGDLNLKNLHDWLLEEATKREYSPAEIASLSMLPDNTFEFPFWAVSGSKKFEAILTSIYTNNIIRQKMHGGSFVLVSEEGTKGKSAGTVYTKAYDPTIGLKPMRLEDGVVKAAQVLMPWRYQGAIKDYMTDGYIDTTKLPQELLEVFGFRIPAQGHQSMSLVEVVGFTPEIMGDIVIASRNFITQMGSDFDIDKLYIYTYSTLKVEDQLQKDVTNEENRIKNAILDIHKAVLQNPQVFDSVVQPLSNVKDTPTGKELKAIYRQQVTNYLSPDYKKQKYVESVDGKAMVGITALANTLNPILQEYEMTYSYPPDPEGNQELRVVTFGNDRGGKMLLSDLSSPLTWRGNTKNSIQAARLSAAVDNEKDPNLFYTNTNPITAPFIGAMEQLGLEEDHIYNMTAQKVIREYVQTVNSYRSVIGTYSRNIESALLANTINDYTERYVASLSPSKAAQFDLNNAANYAITVADLKKNLKERSLGMDLAILLKFSEVTDLGKSLAQLQSAINLESSGVGKSALEVVLKNDNIERIFKIKNIRNAPAVLAGYSGDMIKNGLISAKDDLVNSKNTVFHYNSRSFYKIRKAYEEATGVVPTLNTLEDLWDNYKSYLFTQALGHTNRKDLFFSKNTLALRTKEFLKTKEGATNPFLIRLNFDTMRKPHLISYNASKEEYVDELNIYRGFVELLSSNNETTKKLGSDLVEYFYLNGGVQKAREWGKYIHPGFLKQFKQGEFLTNLKNTNFQDQDPNGISPIPQFLTQYFQHKPYLLPFIGKEQLKFVKINDKKNTLIIPPPTTDSSLVSLISSNDEYFPILTIPNAAEAKGYSIYVRGPVGNQGAVMYYKISVLGTTNYTEYSKSDNAQSLRNKNFTKGTLPIEAIREQQVKPKKDTKTIANSPYKTIGEFLDNGLTDPNYKALAEVMKLKDFSAYTLEYVDALPGTRTAGTFSTGDKTIRIHKNVLNLERTLFHEITHAATMERLNGYDNNPEQEAALNSFRRIADSLRQRILDGELESSGLKAAELIRFDLLNSKRVEEDITEEEIQELLKLRNKYYGFSRKVDLWTTNYDEFMAELFSNEEFQHTLNSIKYDTNRSFLDRLLDVLMKVLNALGAKKNSALEAALRDAVIIIGNDQFETGVHREANYDTQFSIDILPPVELQMNKDNYRGIIERYESRLKFIEQSIATSITSKDKVRTEELRTRHEEVKRDLHEFKEQNVFARLLELGNKDLDNAEKILRQAIVSPNDINYVLRMIKTWEEVDELVLDPSDITDLNQRAKDISQLTAKAQLLYNKWNQVAKNALLNAVKYESGLENIKEDVLNAQEKVNALTANLMDISRTGNLVLDVMSKWMREADYRSNLEAKEVHDKTLELADTLKTNEWFKKEGYYVFAQTKLNADSGERELTGEMVRPLSADYYETRNELIKIASEEADKEKRKVYWKKYFDWVRTNHFFVDMRKLYKQDNDGKYIYTPDTIYLDKFKKATGKKFDELLKEQQNKIEYYNERLESKALSLDKNDPDYFRALEKWKLTNDPVIYLNTIFKKKTVKNIMDGEYVKNEGQEYVVKRAYKKWEDKQYSKIKADPTLSAFYEHSVKTLNNLYKMLPMGFRTSNETSKYTIPSVAKSLIETYNEKGMNAAVNHSKNSMLESVSITETQNQVRAIQDPITNKPLQALKVRYLNTLTPEERSYDLAKVINIFSLEAISFKHKSMVEDSIRLAQSILEQSLEVVRSPSGDQMLDRFGRPLTVKDGKNLQDQMEHAIRTFYGTGKNIQGTTKKKVFTNKANSKDKALNDAIAKDAYSEGIVAYIRNDLRMYKFANELKAGNKITTEEVSLIKEASRLYLEKNTRNVVGSKIGDVLLQYMQLKGMGWNVFSSVTNVTFGWIANFQQAARGVDFNLTQMAQANKIMLSATGRGVGISSVLGAKINALMVKFDVLKELNDAAFESTSNTNRVKKGINNLAPFELQRRGEYFVQGMTMVASMLNTNVTLSDGRVVNLFEAFDNNGEFIEPNKDWSGSLEDRKDNKKSFEFKFKLDQINKRIHGNYDPNSPVRIKSGILGRAVMQFRSWIAEGVADRVEGRKYDLFLGRERQGRWRTYGELGFSKSLSALLKVAKGDNIEGLNPEDAALVTENMKANLMELYMSLTLIALYLVLKQIELDDDDEWGKRAANFTVNQVLRLQDDIEFYYSPLAAENITQNFIPVFTLVRDGWKFKDAIEQGILDGEWEYKTGKKAGENRVLWTGAKVFPFGSSVASFLNKTETEEGFRK